LIQEKILIHSSLINRNALILQKLSLFYSDYFREKKWVTIGETTMKIYKWVPISSSEQKKKIIKGDNKENTRKSHIDGTNSTNFGTEDSNTCI